MSSGVEQQAVVQSLCRLPTYLDFPGQGAAVLDASGSDADATPILLEKGAEVARLDDLGLSKDQVTALQGTPAATGLPEASLDMWIATGQRAKSRHPDMLFEAARVLKPQAPLILSYAAPVTLPGTVAALSDALILQFNPFWQMQFDAHQISPTLNHLAMSGFVGGECHSQDASISFTRETWISYCCQCPQIEDARLSPAELQDFRLVLGDYIRRDFGQDDFFVPFRTLTYLAYKPG